MWAAAVSELAGADGITVHLREDRRHIQDRDISLLRETVRTRMNLELAVADEILAIAEKLRPEQATIVPERREEVTTEGGLDVLAHREAVGRAIRRLEGAGIEVSLFLDPDPEQVRAGIELGARAIELHTGRYADATTHDGTKKELEALEEAGKVIREAGVSLHAGHGLNYTNVGPVATITGMLELNIGHAIVSRAVFVGLDRAVVQMKEAIRDACLHVHR